MAIDFNATTSKLEHTTAAIGITTTVTICAHAFADGVGEGGSGRIASLDETSNSIALLHNSSVDSMRLLPVYSTTNGNFTFPATDSQWNAIGVSYDAGSVANDPVARVNFAPVTVTRATAPVGTFTQPLSGYCVGNRTTQTGTWDGMLKHVQIFDVLLTAGEMDQALRRPGSVRRGLRLWLPMLHAGHVVDWSGNGFNGTATALTDRVGGPRAAPLYYNEKMGSFVVSSGGGSPIPVTTTFSFSGHRRIVVNQTGPAGETNSILLDKSSIVGPNGEEPSRLVIEKIDWNVVGGGTLTFSFDHTTDDIVAVVSGEGSITYPDGGVVDPSSAGGTGDLFVTSSAASGGSYNVIVTLRLKD